MELGPGTDLRASTALMPKRAMRPLVDPRVLREGTPDHVRALVSDILRNTADAPAVTLCAWSFDRDTPIPNVAALYETVTGYRE
jgi:hypothetical protein